MKAKLLVLFTALFALTAFLIVFQRGKSPNIQTPPVEISKDRADPTNSAVPNESMMKLRSLATNPSNAAGAVTSYEIRELIADRLKTNEEFLHWATNVARTKVLGLVKDPRLRVYGVQGLSAENLTISVDVKAVGGLSAQVGYDPSTNSEGPLYFEVVGGTKPVISYVQNHYRTVNYQIDARHRGPRPIGQMDWSGATSPLDHDAVEAMAREAYFDMTGAALPAEVVPNVNTPPFTDPTVQDPDVQVTGAPGATVATANNRRYPFADFACGEARTPNPPFSGEVVQTRPGDAQIVSLNLVLNLQQSVVELGERFLGANSPNWAQDILGSVGSTPPDQVLRKLWQVPNR